MLNNTDPYSALEAKTQAQKLAFSPILFHTARTLRDLNILSTLDTAGVEGLPASLIAEKTGISEYGVKVLLDMALSAHIVCWKNPNYILAKIGYFLLHDGMTTANMDFTADVCYAAMQHLTEAITTGKPAGLKELGEWQTVYEGLSTLPDKAKASWFAFDHFYSDRSFPILLKKIFSTKPKHIVDIGGNTGKWAIQCCKYDPEVNITIVDLPNQLKMAMNNAQEHGFSERISSFAANLLDKNQALPKDADVWWMSQFLDCFSPMEILSILNRVRKSLKSGSIIYILELFPDAQKYSAASYSLNATSLYFTCLANGNSRFYRSNDFLEIIEQSGLEVIDRQDNIGMGHTLLKVMAKTGYQ